MLVAPGLYSENIDFKGKAITVTSGAKQFSEAAGTIIRGAADGFVATFSTGESAAAILNGFTIRGGHSSVATRKYTGGISISAASPTITNNIVTDNTGCGVLIANNSNTILKGNDTLANHNLLTASGYYDCSSTARFSGVGLAILDPGYVQVIGNTIEKNYASVLSNNQSSGSRDGGGILVSGGNKVLLQGNIVRDNISQSPTGLYTAPMPKQVILVQNLFYGGTQPNGVQQSVQILFFGSFTPTSQYPSITEINNTIYGAGEALGDYFGPSEISNNLFFNSQVSVRQDLISSYVGLSCYTPQTTLNVHHNDIFNNGVLQSNGCTQGPGSLSVDPQFLNSAAADLHTQPNAPGVAAGTITAPLIPPADLDGKARVVCGTIDMGAYETRPRPVPVVASSNNPSVGGTAVTLTARVPGNCNVPSGTVTFLDGGSPIGTVALDASGFTSLTTAASTVGSHAIIVTYPGTSTSMQAPLTR